MSWQQYVWHGGIKNYMLNVSQKNKKGKDYLENLAVDRR
jgi:hypothetical protein